MNITHIKRLLKERFLFNKMNNKRSSFQLKKISSKIKDMKQIPKKTYNGTKTTLNGIS